MLNAEKTNSPSMVKNILYIAPATSVRGGISTVVRGFLRSSLTNKYNIICVASHVDGSKFRKILQAIAGLMFTFYNLTFRKIDIVHIHGGDVTSAVRKYFFYRLSRLFSCKIIYHFHGASFMDQYTHLPSVWKKRIKWLLEDAEIVICLSLSWRDAVKTIAPCSKIVVIYNSVPLPIIPDRRNSHREDMTISFLGLIGERKGVFDLLKAFSRLKDEGLRVQLCIGGNGDIKKLFHEIDSDGLKDSVRYLGWVNGGTKDKLFYNTDIFVLPSYAEGMPMSILEAMSYGIPVVASRVGGIPEVITDGANGYLVAPGNISELHSKIRELVTNEPKRMLFGFRSRKLIEENHNLATAIHEIENLYNTL